MHPGSSSSEESFSLFSCENRLALPSLSSSEPVEALTQIWIQLRPGSEVFKEIPSPHDGPKSRSPMECDVSDSAGSKDNNVWLHMFESI